MVRQHVMAGIAKRIRLPWWKRLVLIAALLLPGEALVAVVSSQAAHAEGCNTGGGWGGPGGVAYYVNGEGARGGNGGDCVIWGSAKGGTGGTAGANGGDGGNVFFGH